MNKPLRALDYVPVKRAEKQQIDVLYALILHDIKSRFFGNGLGYCVTIVWPLVHIVVILLINKGRIAPYGSSMVLYAATAVMPWIAANYVGRFIMLGVITNKSFLQYPIVKPMDMVIARSILEIVGNFIVVSAILGVLYLIGIDVMPVNTVQAALAWLTSIMLGVGLGIFGGVICLAFPLFQLVFILFIIVAWVTCGIGIDPEFLPESYGYFFSFNPVLHAVEWMRSAYYINYHAHLLDKSYLIICATVTLSCGIIMERVCRSFWITSR